MHPPARHQGFQHIHWPWLLLLQGFPALAHLAAGASASRGLRDTVLLLLLILPLGKMRFIGRRQGTLLEQQPSEKIGACSWKHQQCVRLLLTSVARIPFGGGGGRGVMPSVWDHKDQKACQMPSQCRSPIWHVSLQLKAFPLVTEYIHAAGCRCQLEIATVCCTRKSWIACQVCSGIVMKFEHLTQLAVRLQCAICRQELPRIWGWSRDLRRIQHEEIQ